MQRHYKIIIGVFLGAALVVLVSSRDKKEKVNWKSLNDCVWRFGKAKEGTTQRAEAVQAIQVLCTNHLSELVNSLNYDRAPRERRIAYWTRWLPAVAQTWVKKTFWDRREGKAVTASLALAALGSDAAPAIPALLNLAHQTNAELRAKFTLAGLGTNSLPALLEDMRTNPFPTHPDPIDLLLGVALGDPRAVNRSGTVEAIMQSPAARQALPSLVQALSNPDPAIRALAKEALAKFAPFINSTGTFAFFAEKLTVVVAETAPGKLNYEIGFGAIQSGPAMVSLRSDRPWFIYPSAPGAVWIYDGDRELNLLTFSNQTITASSSLAHPDLLWRAPPEVVARLPQEMKAR